MDVLDGTIVTTFLATLNAGAGFAGYTDWRIPNINELQSLANYENVDPAADTAFNTSCAASCTVLTCSCTVSGDYWSSTANQSYRGWVWIFSGYDGRVTQDSLGLSEYVRAVRGGP